MNHVWYSEQKDQLILTPMNLWEMWLRFEQADLSPISHIEKENDNSGRVYMTNGDVMEYLGEI